MGSNETDRFAAYAMGLLILSILAWAVLAPWQSPWAVDERSWLEMIEGVARHGLPCTTNGPVDQFPELQARWNLARDGKLWGNYPPAFAYVAAPSYILGGANGVIKMNICILAGIALGVFFAGKKLYGKAMWASAAAWVTVVATPIPAMAVLISPYPFVVACITWSMVLTLRSLGAQGRCSDAVAAGCVAGIAAASHGIALPWLLFLIGAHFVSSSMLRRLASRYSAAPRRVSSILVAVGALPPIVCVALLNHVRFDSFNPFSVGPCVWRGCSTPLYRTQDPMTIAPCVLWAAITLTLLCVAKSRFPRWILPAAIFSVVIAVAIPVLRNTIVEVTDLLAALLVDANFANLLMAPDIYYKSEDGVGIFFGPYVVKAAFQGSPVLLLAISAPFRSTLDRKALFILIGGAVATLAGVTVRGLLHTGPHTVGYPFIFFRYAVPAMPFLVLLAVSEFRILPWKARHLFFGFAIVVLLTAWFSMESGDNSMIRRLVLLYLPVVIGFAAIIAVASARRAAGVQIAAVLNVILVVALSVAVCCGHDTAAVCRILSSNDDRVRSIAAVAPSRFALVGYPREIDPAVALRESFDLQYADLFESRGTESIDALVHWWLDEPRTVFYLAPPEGGVPSEFDRLYLDPVAACPGVYEVAQLRKPGKAHPR